MATWIANRDGQTISQGGCRSLRKFSIASHRAISKPNERCWAAFCCCRIVCDDVALVILRPEDFYDDANRRVFDAFSARCTTRARRIDTTLLVERLRTTGDYERCRRRSLSGRSLAVRAHGRQRQRTMPQIVRDKATLRALIHSSTEILRDAYDETDEATRTVGPGRAENLFDSRQRRGGRAVVHYGDDPDHEAMLRIDARMKQEHAMAAASQPALPTSTN